MAKTKISEFNANPALNTDIDSINIAEGCAPSGINDAIRELMAQLKDWQAGTSNDPMVIGSSGSLTLNQGTANGVAYLNGSKVVTSGSALTFDGTNWKLGNPTTVSGYKAQIYGDLLLSSGAFGSGQTYTISLGDGNAFMQSENGQPVAFGAYNGFKWGFASTDNKTISSEWMRLTSTGLGIGTSSPAARLSVVTASANSTAATIGGIEYGGSKRGLTIKTYQSAGGDDCGVEFNAANGLAGYGAFKFAANTTTLATLDSSGNLGLGVTPSAWAWPNGSAGALQLQSGAGLSGYNASTYLSQNWYYNGGEKYIGNGYANRYGMYGGGHAWFNAPNNTSGAGATVSWTQAMTLDASGRWLLGTTTGVGNDFTSIRFNSSSTYSQGMNMVDANASSNGGVFMVFRKSDDTGLGAIKRSGTDTALAIDGNSYLAFQTGSTERARIDSSGKFLVGTTAALQSAEKMAVLDTSGNNALIAKQEGGSAGWCGKFWNNATSGDNKFVEFTTETSITARGSITYNRAGGLTAYNTTSDYRAKDISGPVTNSGALIDATPVYMGKMKGATQERPMFIAHETPSYAHTGEKDAVDEDGNPVYQQMDASALIPVMWAEIQSLRARVAQLESN